MTWKLFLTGYPSKSRGSLRGRRTLIPTLVVSVFATALVLFGVGEIKPKAMTTVRTEDPVVLGGQWPLYGIGPLFFLFVQ